MALPESPIHKFLHGSPEEIFEKLKEEDLLNERALEHKKEILALLWQVEEKAKQITTPGPNREDMIFEVLGPYLK